jgi:hypothetical protein
MRARTNAVAEKVSRAGPRDDPGGGRLRQTRGDVEKGWQALGEILAQQGQPALAEAVARFARQMPPPRTEKEHLAEKIKASLSERAIRERQRTR